MREKRILQRWPESWGECSRRQTENLKVKGNRVRTRPALAPESRAVGGERAPFTAWDPTGTRVRGLCDAEVYAFCAYGGAKMNRKSHVDGLEAQELGGQAVGDAFSMAE